MEMIQQFLDQYGLLAIFVLLLVKGLGVPIPIPGDFLMLLAGVRAASGDDPLWLVMGALMAAVLLAGGAQYALARGPSRAVVYRFGRYVGLTPPRLDKAADAVRKRGPVAVAIGTMTPGLGMLTVIAAGLAGLAAVRFAGGLTVGSTIFIALHIVLGYLFGPSVLTMLDNIHLPVVPVLVGLALVGLAVWLGRSFLRRRRGTAAPDDEPLRAVAAWTEAACPICMVVGRLNLPEAAGAPAATNPV
jgi:membrane protein DedA with SNARE-associated domain